MRDNWIYFGVFLPTISQEFNLQMLERNGIEIPYGWKIYNHHMTIAFNDKTERSQKLYDSYSKYFGKQVKLVIDGIGFSDNALALRVAYDEPIANKIPHITIATPQNGKPVNSNRIKKWIDIKPYGIVGKIQEFAK